MVSQGASTDSPVLHRTQGQPERTCDPRPLPVPAGAEVLWAAPSARGQRHAALLAQLVAAERDIWLAGSRGHASRLTYAGPADLVLREGRAYDVRTSLQLESATPFATALHLAAHGWGYAEGWALRRWGHRTRAVLHAWSISPEGEAVEVHDARPALAYLGVQLPAWRVAVALQGGSVSALDDYRHGWPLLSWSYTWPSDEQASGGDDSHARHGPWRDTELLASLRRRPVVWTKEGRPLSLPRHRRATPPPEPDGPAEPAAARAGQVGGSAPARGVQSPAL